MKKRPSSSEKYLKSIIYLLVAMILAVGAFYAGYRTAKTKYQAELIKVKTSYDELQSKYRFSQSAGTDLAAQIQEDAKRHKRMKRELDELLAASRKEPLRAQHEYDPSNGNVQPPPPPPKQRIQGDTEAKLVIIIDDVSYDHDLEAIRSTELPLVCSFLPPSERHPDSAKLAKNLSRYMVHLPLEAVDFKEEEPFTLRVGDSEETITKRIKQLEILFPKMRYVNNHTGSKFTADIESMERLFKVLKAEGITFIDSRTTAQTKAPEASENLGLRYLGRDVFLDHKDGVENIKKQIALAVEKAKKEGYAIAIGHPRPDTIEALRESKALLRQVKLVGIQQI